MQGILFAMRTRTHRKARCVKSITLCLTVCVCLHCASRISDYPTAGQPTRDPNCPDYSDTQPGFYGGDGSSEDQAVETVGLEYTPSRWIEEHYPGAQITGQELVISPTTRLRFDVMSFLTVEGQATKVWFWISGGLGCFMK